MHPLSALTEEELNSALVQVITLTENTGTTFSSTGMIFGGGGEEDDEDADREENAEEELDGEIDA